MPEDQSIVCRPTPWFFYRLGAVTLMFSVFAVLFYLDGSTGYRQKNEVFYLHRCFEQAGKEFSELNASQDLTPDAWAAHASLRTVAFPPDASILPEGLEQPMPWPEVLHDHERMKSLQWNQLWLDFSAAEGLDSTPPEQPYDARKIHEQWVFFYICSGLSAVSLFFLIRTSMRSLRAGEDGLTGPGSKFVAYGDFHRLDLRKWDSKGIAYADYDGESGKGRLRIDGLTYGGFKSEHGEPAEKLMQRLRSRFSGELIEYSLVDADEPESDDSPADPERPGQ